MPLNGPPVPEGTHDSDEAIVPEPNESPLLTSQNVTLENIAKDYAFFNHGILFTWFPDLSIDPVQQYVNAAPAGTIHVGFLDFDEVVIEGLGDTYGRRLFFTPKDKWPDLRDAITMSGVVNRETGFVGRMYWAEVQVVDWLAMRNDPSAMSADEPPKVPVTLFGMKTNKFYSAVTMIDDVYNTPRLVSLSPQ